MPQRNIFLKKSNLRHASQVKTSIPLIVWIWLALAVCWIGFSISYPASPAGTEPQSQTSSADINHAAALATYFTNFAAPDTMHLSNDDAVIFNNKLAKFEADTSNQIAAAIYPRVPEGAIEQFTIKVAERSRLGRQGLDNGAILFVFLAEKVARLEVGYGLEGVLTDADSHYILDTQLIPALGKGEFGNGIDHTLDAIFSHVQDAYHAGRMPGTLTVMWHQLKVKIPKLMPKILPALNALGLIERIAISFFAGFLLYGMRDGLQKSARLIRNSVRGVSNLISRRAFTDQMENVPLESIIDTIKLLALLLVLVSGAAGAVIVAAGGTFGGAGAQLHW